MHLLSRSRVNFHSERKFNWSPCDIVIRKYTIAWPVTPHFWFLCSFNYSSQRNRRAEVLSFKSIADGKLLWWNEVIEWWRKRGILTQTLDNFEMPSPQGTVECIIWTFAWKRNSWRLFWELKTFTEIKIYSRSQTPRIRQIHWKPKFTVSNGHFDSACNLIFFDKKRINSENSDKLWIEKRGIFLQKQF